MTESTGQSFAAHGHGQDLSTGTDADLVASVLRKDPDAFGELYRRYGDAIRAYCRRKLSDRQEAEDAAQDTFLAAMEHIAELRDPERLRAWLYTIAARTVIRRSMRRKRDVPIGDPEVIDLFGSARPADGPEASALRGERENVLRDATNGLTAEDRTLVHLYLQGLENSELAEALSIRSGAAAVRLHRAKARLRESLDAVAVSRRGRSCPDLDELLRRSGWDGTMTPLLRKRVVRHIRSCTRCDGLRRRLVTPELILAVTAVLATPEDIRAEVWDLVDPFDRANTGVRLASSVADLVPPTPAAGTRPATPGGVAQALATAGVVTVLLLGFFFVLQPRDAGPQDSSAAPQLSVSDPAGLTTADPPGKSASPTPTPSRLPRTGPPPPTPAPEPSSGRTPDPGGPDGGAGPLGDAPAEPPAAAPLADGAAPTDESCVPPLQVSPGVRIVDAPASVFPEALTDPSDILVFTEQLGRTLTAPIDLDPDGSGPAAPVTIPAGTVVDSYLAAVEGPGFDPAVYRGTVGLPADLLGLAATDQQLDATDGQLANPSTSYPGGVYARGAEFPLDGAAPSAFDGPLVPTRADDLVEPDGPRGVRMRWSSFDAGDTVRIVTAAAAPEGCGTG